MAKGTSTEKDALALKVLVEAGILSSEEAAKAQERARQEGLLLSDVVLSEHSSRLLIERKVKVDESEKAIGDFLVEAGWLTQEQLSEVRKVQDASDKTLGKILLEQGVISQEQLETAVSEQKRTGNPFWRTLMRFALPKQISEAMRAEVRFPFFRKSDEKLVDILKAKKIVPADRLNSALEKSRTTRKPLQSILMEEGLISEEALTDALASGFNLPVVDLEKQPVQPQAVRMLPESIIVENQALPIEKTEKALIVAFADPVKISVLEQAGVILGLELKPVLAIPSQIRKAIETHVGVAAAVVGEEAATPQVAIAGEPFSPTVRIEIGGTPLEDLTRTGSNIDIVNGMIEGAVMSRATDIHLDPQEGAMRVRYRIDGMLHDVMALPASLVSGVITRIKVMAVLDIIERRRPQDGHINMQVLGRSQDMRVAAMPSMFGEKMTIRLLSESHVLTGLNLLGLEPDQLKTLERLIHKPYGMLLAVGPVGSGKTTTLYSSLNRVNVLTKNVMTIEDPVEYKLRGTNQVQVNPHVDLGFAEGLRSMLRQDPNIIMVGEIRDAETAKIAVRAALTGVLVFSTMHSDEASGAVTVLFNYGIPGFLVSDGLIGVIAQRLVRKICASCKEEYKPPLELLKQMVVREKEPESVRFYRGKGCSKCFQTGYMGRTGSFEIMEMSEILKDLTFRQTTKEVIRQVAIDMGMQTLKESTYHKVKEGTTTPEEYFRAVFV